MITFNIRLAADEQCRKLESSCYYWNTCCIQLLSWKKITQTEQKRHFLFPEGANRVWYCSVRRLFFVIKVFFIQSVNDEITIDAPADKDYVTVLRKFPNRPDLTGQIRCTYELGNIIQALCEALPEKGQETRRGLGVTYSDLLPALEADVYQRCC